MGIVTHYRLGWAVADGFGRASGKLQDGMIDGRPDVEPWLDVTRQSCLPIVPNGRTINCVMVSFRILNFVKDFVLVLTLDRRIIVEEILGWSDGNYWCHIIYLGIQTENENKNT